MSQRVGIVTGASSGIGLATAKALVKDNFSLVVNARRSEPLEELIAEFGKDRIVAVVGDVTKQEIIEKLFESAKCFGKSVDLVCVNAGRGLRGSLLESDIDGWKELIDLNITASLELMRASALYMKEHCPKDPKKVARDIVVIGSCVGRNINSPSGLYSISKIAINNATEMLRRELASARIRVSLIEPGLVHTGFHDAAGYPEGFYDNVSAKYDPVLVPEDIARTIHFIVSQPPHVHIDNASIRPVMQEYP